ncbi:hypothetical protein HYS91_05310 [Candidatus Daviesbacteria bacterium]|nr:hypothetical protein [Candidatus Daviesbacteria bacterium]
MVEENGSGKGEDLSKYQFMYRVAEPITTVLKQSARMRKTNRDIVYTSRKYLDYGDPPKPFCLAVSPEGTKLLKESDRLLKILALTLEDEEIATHLQNLNLPNFNAHIAGLPLGVSSRIAFAWIQVIEKSRADFQGEFHPLSGLERFDATRALEDEGFECFHPYVATNWKYVVEFPTGVRVKQEQSNLVRKAFEGYLEVADRRLKRLKRRGFWQPHWKLRTDPEYYYIVDLRHKRALKRFKAFDPVTS